MNNIGYRGRQMMNALQPRDEVDDQKNTNVSTSLTCSTLNKESDTDSFLLFV
ncbi:unnamed protein product [Acanthoscelides obtectus]|uniref:Uncharacterized protein n=1 Tax=Acanthoscelides obtectus TaxID=200917 RepID=A0A9P0LFF8_ACAOB|nr:unnamed protein product [Acanthoscelides obtectus]CAK1643835.1 hypothetical protein AOBTE_LOCUS13696 [Acanthoscelides obtectus]